MGKLPLLALVLVVLYNATVSFDHSHSGHVKTVYVPQLI